MSSRDERITNAQELAAMYAEIATSHLLDALAYPHGYHRLEAAYWQQQSAAWSAAARCLRDEELD